MSTRTAELLAGIGLLVFSLALMWSVYADGLTIGWVDGRGPGAGVWPFWLSLGMALTSVWTLVRWARRTTPESRDESPYIDSDPLALVATSFIALTASSVHKKRARRCPSTLKNSQSRVSISQASTTKCSSPVAGSTGASMSRSSSLHTSPGAMGVR